MQGCWQEKAKNISGWQSGQRTPGEAFVQVAALQEIDLLSIISLSLNIPYQWDIDVLLKNLCLRSASIIATGDCSTDASFVPSPFDS